MENFQSLQQLEALCERLYNAQTAVERSQAEGALRVFGASTEYIPQCKAILDSSASPYAQLMASSSLLKLVTEHTVGVTLRLEMRNYFLSYLDSKGPQLEPYVVTSMVQLLCRTTKLGWFDDDQHRNIVEDSKRFLERGMGPHYLLGLKILNMLVTECNQPTPGRTLTQHRKIAVSFRDLALFKIFQMSLIALRQLYSDPASDDKLREQGLSLALQCLSFDFVGTCLDESAEDLGTIQVPSAWRSVIEDPATLKVFLDFYAATKPPLSNLSLECLVRLASVRRSLFTNETERSKFLNALVNGTRDILRTQMGLDSHANYHEYCRLLGRLKTNYQLAELVSVENYIEWIELVAQFTINSLKSWQWASASVYYLLGLWSRLVSSTPYLKGDSPSLLETYVPRIIEAYVMSRLESVTTVLQNGSTEDPLDNEEQLQDQLDSLPYLCRFQYDKMSKYICSLMDPIIAMYTQWRDMPPDRDPAPLAVIEGQLTWLVYIVGAVIRGRLSSSSAESQETIDGDLAARVFGVLSLVDNGYHVRRYGEHTRQRLDIALLAFFQNFRKVYVGEQAMHSSKVYTRLNERLGLSDHLMVLNVVLGKIATNLKVYGAAEEIIHLTLNLFQDLASGYMSGKLLLKLEATSFILTHHTRDHFAFLDDPANARNRTTFYYTLARLLFMEDTPSKFKAFMDPLNQVLTAMAAHAGSAQQLRMSVPKQSVVGLLRDLRGVTMATNSRRTYGMLFDMLYPAHFPVLLRCLEAWADDPEVTTPLLKFVAEFVMNKMQRLTFDSSSPNGILLFREVSKILVIYGAHALKLGAVSDVYGMKCKGIWICLTILMHALAGNYVNFGVFELYGDRALADALEVALKMALSIPQTDIMAYRKVGKAYFELLEVLCHNHPAVIAQCDTATFSTIVSSLEQGLKSLDVAISSKCAAAVDNLAAFYFKSVTQAEGGTPSVAAQNMAEHIRLKPNQFPDILRCLFEIVLFEECSNQWSLSRPMLSLILINEPLYNDIKNQIIASQPADKQAHLDGCMQKLMTDVQCTLEPKNRDKFTQNLTMVRHDFRAKT
uniref:Exportin-7/Ran-binding protein 17 TPR repeats domain-containing protein n=1 Tax=Tetraselmis chuii TaxID=63592 RepID=A0A7S1SV05_9CHLO|mmetsp:Transcript_3093/g.5630  ORF Transcript_3093/g.5630 Transcript_3093/m.5630 type:complete len:1061 (+) Transcript_3093:282-3464(+)|eukprot:CAMPEP_0177761844 /NCGR_PEP_ID=MMETSP0491_2-20121128/6025_1 /TAXON_ID=63592 /ORGANISM="Tetraselmis chuii, Strain PLY429" /LENGTH=1060 /DNA_ID=CAMNT_0019277853 /DNA_START=226 /DNA_END=3408 /DNA_ORIENTATION=+